MKRNILDLQKRFDAFVFMFSFSLFLFVSVSFVLSCCPSFFHKETKSMAFLNELEQQIFVGQGPAEPLGTFVRKVKGATQ